MEISEFNNLYQEVKTKGTLQKMNHKMDSFAVDTYMLHCGDNIIVAKMMDNGYTHAIGSHSLGVTIVKDGREKITIVGDKSKVEELSKSIRDSQ